MQLIYIAIIEKTITNSSPMNVIVQKKNLFDFNKYSIPKSIRNFFFSKNLSPLFILMTKYNLKINRLMEYTNANISIKTFILFED